MRTVVDMATAMNKLLEAAMVVLQASPEQRLNITVLNKALFYLDLYALRDHGDVVTGHDYIALPQGPVLDSYPSSLVRPLTESALAEQIEEGKAKPIRVVRRLGKFSHLSASELALAERIGSSFGSLTSMMVSDFSHRNPGWQLAFRDFDPKKPGHKINMLIALQQLDEPDESDSEWMNAPLDEQTMAACNRAQFATLVWE